MTIDQKTRELAALLAPSKSEPVMLRQGIVYSVEYGTITVQISGSMFPIGGIRHLNSYVPTIGDPVWLLKNGPDLIAIGNLRELYAPTGVEDVHWVGTTDEPNFQNGWSNYSSSWNDVGFYRDPDGVVYLSGVIGGGSTTSTMFTLPTGYRPRSNRRFAVKTSNGSNSSSLWVFTNGVVRLTATGTNDNTWVSLNGICFVADGTGNMKGTPNWETEWVNDSRYSGSTLAWRWSDDEATPAVWARGDGLHIYRGYIGAASSQSAQIMRQFPFEMAPRFARMYALIAWTSGLQTTHMGRRVDLDVADGPLITSQGSAWAFGLDGIHWWDRRIEPDYIDLTSALNPTWAQPYNNGGNDWKWGPPRAYVDKYGRVWLTGLLNPTDGIPNGSTIMTLPEGLRPSGIKQMFCVATTGGEARIDVFPSGTVQVTGSGNTYLSLDQIHFRTDM